MSATVTTVTLKNPVDMVPMFDRLWAEIGGVVLGHQRCVGYSARLTPNHRWYCLRVHPGHDYLAASLLALRDVLTFVPMFVDRSRRDRMTGAALPRIGLLFPGYLFVAMDRSREELLPRCRVNGFKEVLGGNGGAIPLRPGVVEGWIARAGQTGLIDDTAPLIVEAINQGDTVQFHSGPFMGERGICSMSSGDRVCVLLGAARLTVSADRSAVARA